MRTCFPDITPSLLRTHRHSMRLPKWATLKLPDDFSMRCSSQLIVLHILHVEANTPRNLGSLCACYHHACRFLSAHCHTETTCGVITKSGANTWHQHKIISMSEAQYPCWQQHDQATGNMHGTTFFLHRATPLLLSVRECSAVFTTQLCYAVYYSAAALSCDHTAFH